MRGKYLGLASLLVAGMIHFPQTIKNVNAESCPDLRVVFVRGSGGIRWDDDNYQTFRDAVAEKLALTGLTYESIDLDYPAIGIGLDSLDVTIGALVGSGDAYQFGESVDTGVKNLVELVNNSSCSTTKYIIGGYSQGAMVVSKSLGSLNADKVVYAATFGDPKIYLPEGEGLIPAACKGENLSDYRMYVPDCKAYQGLLGSYIPYEPIAFEGKFGTWCNKGDLFCSSHWSALDHAHYMADGLYEDAAKVIYSKVINEFGLESNYTSPHDTAILIDSTGSMASMIEEYKAEALRLATETFEAGGRVALYDYRDLNDPYEPNEHCNFETCTLEIFKEELSKIQADNGGDTPESLLSASIRVMKDLTWNYGSTKSLVVLTDADFLSPDRDGITFDDVVATSKLIDPVNFYIITNSEYEDYYLELAEATGGKVVSNFNEVSLLTDYIMERYDSLPRVEEEEIIEENIPTLEIIETEQLSEDSVKVSFKSSTGKTIVVLNDALLGITDESEIILTDLDRTQENILVLTPISEEMRGKGVSVKIQLGGMGEALEEKVIIPKAPDTGIVKDSSVSNGRNDSVKL